jgi:D-beta-D-heptose 7-phosphate kinase / D-beta-D-heptose 1-phosphate adenosyltransferase
VRGPFVVVGDTLLDRDVTGRVERVSPDAPVPVVDETASVTRPGGAGLAAALAAAPDAAGGEGREVVLVTALGRDEAGREVARLLDRAGVRVIDVGLAGPTPEKVRIRAGDRSLLRLDRNCAPVAGVGPLPREAVRVLRAAAAVLVSDYGRGVSAASSVRSAVAGRPARTPAVWDPHPRGARPVAGCRLVTPNRAEASGLAPETGPAGGLAGRLAGGPASGPDWLAAAETVARSLRDRWEAAAVTVTLGAHGALVVDGPGPAFVVPAPPVGTAGDPCGAGARFAAAAGAALAAGAVVSEAVVAAVHAASRFVAAGGAAAVRFGYGATPPEPPGPARAEDVVAAARARGGTVVATGGCFDVVHAGHVSLLEGARALGDCLVVCLNSDESVRRLKGAGRPRSPEGDREAVLLALSCVDAVAVFDEDTPAAVLDRLRPDVFVKGGDYAGADLPEAETLARWGGQAVVLPYLAGRSTTRLFQEVVSQ